MFEIAFDDEGIGRKEILHRIFWLWSVLLGNSGFGKTRKIRWTDIESVYVFKQDAYTSDRICMGFLLKDGESFELSESMNGWENLIEELPKRLPGCKKFHEWFADVAFPAFETNFTKIY